MSDCRRFSDLDLQTIDFPIRQSWECSMLTERRHYKGIMLFHIVEVEVVEK